MLNGQVEGERAIEKGHLQREFDSMKDFMEKKDLQPVRVNRALTFKMTNHKNLLKAAVEAWMRTGTSNLKIKLKEEEFVAKAIRRWKKWLKVRKLCQKTANFIAKRREKPNLHQAFKRWKHYQNSGEKVREHIEKPELVKL